MKAMTVLMSLPWSLWHIEDGFTNIDAHLYHYD